MTKQDSLRAKQRQNELNAFRRYERQYWLAYARSQNPHPPNWQCASHSRQLQRHCQLDALD